MPGEVERQTDWTCSQTCAGSSPAPGSNSMVASEVTVPCFKASQAGLGMKPYREADLRGAVT